MVNFESIVSGIKQIYGEDRDFIPLHEPKFIGNEKKYLNDCIDSTFVSSVGPFVDEFERKMESFTGAKHAIAVSNGTSALHLALMVANVQPGDIVVTQALSFVATANAILYTNAAPYFIDVELDTLGMSPEALRNFLKDVEVIDNKPIHTPTGNKVGAVVPMHSFGHPVRIEEIIDLCNEYNIPVVEDAAESLGSTINGKQTGTFGLLGAYSFNGNKTITCGGGGILVTNDTELAKKAKHISTQAKIPHKWEYRHDHIGYNYRCPNINAALACAQLEELERFIDNKRETAQLYKEFFKQHEATFFTEREGTKANYWLNTLFFNSKEEQQAFLEYSNSNGVMTRPSWTLLHELDFLSQYGRDSLKNSTFIQDRLVNIPSSVRL